jgi:hypothetical protein
VVSKAVFFGRKKRLEVDAGALDKAEKTGLSDFLRSSLKVDAALNGKRVSIESEQLSPEELKRLVNKFVYHKNLNRKYWVALEGSVVKIHLFEKVKKQEKARRGGTPPSTIAHGW